MQWKPSSRRARRALRAVAAVATAASLVAAGSGPATARPKPTPPKHKVTQSDVNAARAAKDRMSAQVSALSAQIAEAQIQLQQAEAKAELAEQKYAEAKSRLDQANLAAARAEQHVQDAQRQVDTAHARFVDYVRATYMSGNLDGTAGTLLTARDPSAMLQQSAMQQYQQAHQADAIGALQAATVAKSNADAAARRAVVAAAKLKAAAAARLDEARAASVAAQQQKVQLQATMADKQRELDATREQLIRTTQGHNAWLRYKAERRAYLAWKAEQARLRLLAQRRARQAAARQAAAHSGGGSGYHAGPSAPTKGGWSAEKGRRAAQRAMSEVGMPYAWAGGGAGGPSRGVCDPSNGAPFDCNVVGFDCSGLAMYAWGAGWWAHYAAAQYNQAGSFHPGASQLRAGDLIFWSSNGAVGGIHHVAIYIGGGRIVEAPYSGGYVQTASLYEYGGFFGATRPFS